MHETYHSHTILSIRQLHPLAIDVLLTACFGNRFIIVLQCNVNLSFPGSWIVHVRFFRPCSVCLFLSVTECYYSDLVHWRLDVFWYVPLQGIFDSLILHNADNTIFYSRPSYSHCVMCVWYIGIYHDYTGGCSLHHGDIMSKSEGVQYIGDIMIHVEDILSTSKGDQYIGGIHQGAQYIGRNILRTSGESVEILWYVILIMETLC